MNRGLWEISLGLKAMVRAQTMGALASSTRESRDISQVSARIDCQC